MRNPPRYGLMRRILFPYSGEEQLGLKQCLRVILAWALLFPLGMSIVASMFIAFMSFSPERLLMLFLFLFLSGFIIFGSLGTVVVVMSNRAVSIHQSRRTKVSSNTSGGRYGS